MKKQKIQMLVVVILLVIPALLLIFLSAKTQGNWIPQRMTDQMHPWEM